MFVRQLGKRYLNDARAGRYEVRPRTNENRTRLGVFRRHPRANRGGEVRGDVKGAPWWFYVLAALILIGSGLWAVGVFWYLFIETALR
jgi:hypothetical protein